METATAPDATTTVPATDAPPVEGAPPAEEEKKDGENPDDDEELAPRELNEIFEYLDPRIYTPECTLKI